SRVEHARLDNVRIETTRAGMQLLRDAGEVAVGKRVGDGLARRGIRGHLDLHLSAQYEVDAWGQRGVIEALEGEVFADRAREDGGPRRLKLVDRFECEEAECGIRAAVIAPVVVAIPLDAKRRDDRLLDRELGHAAWRDINGVDASSRRLRGLRRHRVLLHLN